MHTCKDNNAYRLFLHSLSIGKHLNTYDYIVYEEVFFLKTLRRNEPSDPC